MELRSDTEAVYAEHAQRLLRLATVLAGPSAAEDVVSAAVLRVLGSPAWNSVENVGAYLTQAVVNEVRSSHRSALRREARERAAHGLRNSEEMPASTEVLDALAYLSVRQRAVVFLTYWMDLPAEAVARELGIGPGSVHKHLARARRTLRGHLS